MLPDALSGGAKRLYRRFSNPAISTIIDDTVPEHQGLNTQKAIKAFGSRTWLPLRPEDLWIVTNDLRILTLVASLETILVITVSGFADI